MKKFIAIVVCLFLVVPFAYAQHEEAYCGDGFVDPGEECDDGNSIDGDGCSKICQIEPEPFAPTCGEDHTQGIIAYWKADGDATDSVDENDGTIHGATFTAGQVGQAFSFDGVDDYVDMADASTNAIFDSITTAFSVEAWVMVAANDVYYPIVSKDNYPGHRFFYLVVSRQNRFFFWVSDKYKTDERSQLYSITTASPGEWYHVVGVYDKNAAVPDKIYINGQLDNTNDKRPLITTHTGTPTNIGRHCYHDYYMDGTIDEVAIYNRALGEEEIQQHYINGLNDQQYCTPEAPLTAGFTWAPEPQDEGSPIDFSDASTSYPEDIVGWSWDFDGLGTSTERNPGFTFMDNGMYNVCLTVTDDDGSTDTVCHEVSVINVAPTVTLTGPDTVDEGNSASYSYTVSDPGTDTFTLSSESCGVGGVLSNSAFDGSTGAGSFDCTFPDGPAGPTVSVTVDDDGGSGSDSLSVTVDNVAPTVTSIMIPLMPVDINEQASFSVDVTFSDPAGSCDDDYTCDFDFDNDGTIDVSVVSVAYGVPEGSCSASLADDTQPGYTEAGVYTVKVTVTDKDCDSGSATSPEFIVIYDPSGDFVTGGGWIMSQEGACPDYCGGPTGKANFGFVSKYKKGESTPTGQTDFQFKAGNLNFHSSSYEWLVIAGANAKYKGVGTINGSGNYGFMLTAIDAELAPSTDEDLFRIKIWDKDTGLIVYDNKMGADDDGYDGTEISGGNIKIHKAK